MVGLNSLMANIVANNEDIDCDFLNVTIDVSRLDSLLGVFCQLGCVKITPPCALKELDPNSLVLLSKSPFTVTTTQMAIKGPLMELLNTNPRVMYKVSNKPNYLVDNVYDIERRVIVAALQYLDVSSVHLSLFGMKWPIAQCLEYFAHDVGNWDIGVQYNLVDVDSMVLFSSPDGEDTIYPMCNGTFGSVSLATTYGRVIIYPDILHTLKNLGITSPLSLPTSYKMLKTRLSQLKAAADALNVSTIHQTRIELRFSKSKVTLERALEFSKQQFLALKDYPTKVVPHSRYMHKLQRLFDLFECTRLFHGTNQTSLRTESKKAIAILLNQCGFWSSFYVGHLRGAGEFVDEQRQLLQQAVEPNSRPQRSQPSHMASDFVGNNPNLCPNGLERIVNVSLKVGEKRVLKIRGDTLLGCLAVACGISEERLNSVLQANQSEVDNLTRNRRVKFPIAKLLSSKVPFYCNFYQDHWRTPLKRVERHGSATCTVKILILVKDNDFSLLV